MKILHLLYESRGDYYGIGGVGERAYQMYGFLNKRHDITILCKKYPGAKNSTIEGTIDGIRHIYAGAESNSLTRTLLSYAYHAAGYVKEHGHEYDIIIEEFSPATPTFLHSYTRTPVILQIQGYTGRLYFNKYNPLFASVLCLFEQFRPRAYQNFIFIDEHTRSRFPLSENKQTAIIPNGVSGELLDIPCREGEYVLYLGRVDIYGKGLDILLAAYSEFARSVPGMGLVIAGDGKEMRRFRSMVDDLPEDTRKNIKLTGWLSGRTKQETICNASFLVLPSRHEVQGIAVLEAMAAGKAVVASDLPELSYILDINAGICFKSGDPMSLARAMSDMAGSTERVRMGANGRAWVKNLPWDKVAKKFEAFLQAVADRHNPE